jgi:hypothetical protein
MLASKFVWGQEHKHVDTPFQSRRFPRAPYSQNHTVTVFRLITHFAHYIVTYAMPPTLFVLIYKYNSKLYDYFYMNM